MKIEEQRGIIYDLHEFNVNIISREIYLHRYIHNESETQGDCGVDYRMAVDFIKNLDFLNQQGTKNILVHQQSRGGDWNDGMAIYDAIKTSAAPVTMLAYAHARSMTSIIIQAADLRILMPNCMFLVHQGWLELSDRVLPALTLLEDVYKESAVMLKIYAERCKNGKFFKKNKMSIKDIIIFIEKKMMEKVDWIMTAEEAVNYGFADGILGKRGFGSIDEIRKQ